VLSIFRRDIGKKYWGVFKKSWGCVGKKITLQKCETNFKDDIKNSILKRFVLTRPKLVKPISVAIEVVSVLIVLVTAWSLVEAAKAGLSLYALGTCNPQQPDACVVANVDYCPENTSLNWFEQWGVIFAALPDRWTTWDAAEFLPENPVFHTEFDESKPVALDIFDPGCDKCLQSFRNQLADGFFESHNVALIPYPTEAVSKDYRFNNSYLVSTYILAANMVRLEGSEVNPAWQIVHKLFDGYDENGVIWQSVMKASETSEERAREILDGWLAEFGYSEEQRAEIRELADSEEIAEQMRESRRIVKEEVRITGVPTTIFDGKKHTGIYGQ
jgi:hypothetical protein